MSKRTVKAALATMASLVAILTLLVGLMLAGPLRPEPKVTQVPAASGPQWSHLLRTQHTLQGEIDDVEQGIPCTVRFPNLDPNTWFIVKGSTCDK